MAKKKAPPSKKSANKKAPPVAKRKAAKPKYPTLGAGLMGLGGTGAQGMMP